jgi:pSer/pThr/pTyr-binding forkhead associated (FHA) protein
MGDDERSIPSPPKFNAPSTNTNDAHNGITNNDTLVNNALDAGKQRAAAPPPPKFNAPSPPPQFSRPAIDPAKAAVLAAAKAAQHATPAQRERMVMEAAAQALAHRTANNNTTNQSETNTTTAPPPLPSAPLGPYHPPSWATTPPTIPFTIEIMKQGTIISTLNLQQMCIDANKGYLTLGRAPTNDILLDHPSSSRLHAVIEFRSLSSTSSTKNKEEQPVVEEDLSLGSGIFLFDPGSTHGCYVNKARIAAGQHLPLHVGDMLRFGESSRIMILCGPAELMVEEGPSREQRKQAAALEALKRRKEKDAAAAKTAMAKAIAAGGGGDGGVSWGFGEDAQGDSDNEKDEIDWREHASNKGLTDKQQKIVDKIRKREARIMHLQKESEKIQLKQRSMEEMSVGQANTIARNEEEVEKAMVEIEELEDQLVASIEDSISGKKKSSGGGSGGGGAGGGLKKNLKGGGGKKRRRGGSDDDSDGGDSGEDSFYDRTGKATGGGGGGGGRRAKIAGGGGGGKTGKEDVVEDAASLYGALETLKIEKTRVEALLQAENAKNTTSDASLTTTPAAAAAASHTAPIAPVAAVDSLDDFMAAVESTIESDRAASLRKELAEIESRIATTSRLLKIADPDEYYKPGSKVAELAIQRAQKALSIEKKRKEAEERQKKEILAAKMAAEAAFIEEKEEDDDEEERVKMKVSEPQVDNVHQLAVEQRGEDQEKATFGLQLQKNKDITTAATKTTTAKGGEGGGDGAGQSAYEKRRAGIAASLQALKQPSTQPQNNVTQETDAATASVLADLAVLQKANRGTTTVEDLAEEEGQQGVNGGGTREMGKEEDVTWMPPKDQKGDGRTALNYKFGY